VSGPAPLTIATCQFAVSADVRANARAIRRQMRTAARRGARLVHFPEAALSGYAGADFPSLQDYDWRLLDAETRGIRGLSAELGLWTILGSTHRQRAGKPHNSLYLIDPRGRVAKRYDKRFLIPRDREHYAPGQRIVTHTLDGVKFALLICFDFRFPEIWRVCLRRGCRVVFFSSYQAQPKRNALMEHVAPATLTTRASENFLHVVANNTSGGRQWYNTRVHRPDGSIAAQAPWNRPAVLVHTLDLAADAKLYNPIGPLALRASRGQLSS
jgi:predicted amidohydrolase